MAYTTLVSTDVLAAHLADPAWIVFDCRHDLAHPEAGEREYRKSHIPGARFAHLDRDLSAPSTGTNGRHPLPDPAVFARTLAAAGVDASKQVVVYDAQGGGFCGRLWWMLKWLGHDAVAVLDGGWAKWLREDHPETDVVPTPTPARFEPRLRDLAVDARFVAAHLREARYPMIDARAPERYRGENETLDPVAGHIPGALNRVFKDNLRADGTFKSAAELANEFRPLLGNASPANVIHQCGSGVSACHNVLAMEIAGLAGSKLYPGSWSEWCADRTRPVATGAQP